MIFNRSKTRGTSGQLAEKAALKYLKERGLTFVTQNYSCRQGEVDLIMEEKDVLVFVEVRYRKTPTHGTAAETVTRNKQNKIRTTAQHYMVTKKIGESRPLRFDVVGIDGSEILWIKNAF